METVYAIFDDCDRCVYLCYSVGEDEYDQYEDMNDWDWDNYFEE